jgi:hypothetical protein
MEGPAQNVVRPEMLMGYGPFFDNARELTNCSYGEPFVSPRIRRFSICLPNEYLVGDNLERSGVRSDQRAQVLGRRIRSM